MQQISEKLKNYKLHKPKSKITNKRQEVIKMFLDRLNEDRKDTKYPPLKPQRLGVMFAYTTTDQLYRFYGDCADTNNFSSYFWWKFKTIKNSV